MAKVFLLEILDAYFFKPASASAPAGSDSILVSSKMSLTAAQSSSIETVITPSTHSLMTSKVCNPI